MAVAGCGNVGISRCLRDSQGAVGTVEKLVLLFHQFPRTRHFHGSPRVLILRHCRCIRRLN